MPDLISLLWVAFANYLYDDSIFVTKDTIWSSLHHPFACRRSDFYIYLLTLRCFFYVHQAPQACPCQTPPRPLTHEEVKCLPTSATFVTVALS